MMLATAAAAAVLASCVPMRWISPDPASLQLLDGSPVSCLLLTPQQANKPLLEAIRKRGLTSIGVAQTPEEAASLAKVPVEALAVAGTFSDKAWSQQMPVIRIAARRDLQLDSNSPVIATDQGVWPSVRQEHSGPKTAAPTGSIWINTNTGVLRYLTSVSRKAVWLATSPPEGERQTATAYAHAIADAASVGAHWVITLDADFTQSLLRKDTQALRDWKQIQTHLRFYEDHKEWRQWRARAELTLVQDASSGALVTGNLLDMLSVMNTPVRPVPARELSSATLAGSKLTVTIHPQDYTPEQQQLIAGFAQQGGKVVRGPDGFRMPVLPGDRITFDKDEYRKMEAIWPELHLAVQRKNFGVRMFNVSGTLTYLQESPDGKETVLQLVNFTDYPVESITAFVEGKFSSARFYSPDAPPRDLPVYDAPEGTGVEIDKLGLCGAVVLSGKREQTKAR